jgi:hypothetical protein
MPQKEYHAAFDAYLYASGIIACKLDYYSLVHKKMDQGEGHRSSREHSEDRFLMDKLSMDGRRRGFEGRELTDCLRVWWGHNILDEVSKQNDISPDIVIDIFVKALRLMKVRRLDLVKYHP